MKNMALAMNDAAEAAVWDTMYAKGRTEFSNVFVNNNNFCTTERTAKAM
jgi:hypothetical protein